MDWETHNKWAERMGIPVNVSDAVNHFVDDIGESEFSAEFEEQKSRLVRSVTHEGQGVAKGNSAFDLVVELHVDEHDSARKLTTDSNIYSRVQRKFLQEKGEEYLKVWYLHHHLDYLWEERNSGKSLTQLLDEYKQKYPQTFSPDVEEFLIDNKEELEMELKL